MSFSGGNLRSPQKEGSYDLLGGVCPTEIATEDLCDLPGQAGVGPSLVLEGSKQISLLSAERPKPALSLLSSLLPPSLSSSPYVPTHQSLGRQAGMEGGREGGEGGKWGDVERGGRGGRGEATSMLHLG